jgi:hypothetical protein
MSRKVDPRIVGRLQEKGVPVEPPPPPVHFARADTEPSAAALVRSLRENRAAVDGEEGAGGDLLSKADAIETWGRVLAVLSFVAAAVWFVGGVGLVKNGLSPEDPVLGGGTPFGGEGAGVVAICVSVAQVVSGFWWVAVHGAAAAHLRGTHTLVMEAQKQNSILADLQDRLTKE